MRSNFDDSFLNDYKALQLQEIKLTTSSPDPQPASDVTNAAGTSHDADHHTAHDSWVTAFNTSLLTTRANYIKDRSAELGELMQSPEFECLLIAAQHLAKAKGYSKEVATERLIETFRKIDFSWKQLVMSRGMKTLID